MKKDRDIINSLRKIHENSDSFFDRQPGSYYEKIADFAKHAIVDKHPEYEERKMNIHDGIIEALRKYDIAVVKGINNGSVSRFDIVRNVLVENSIPNDVIEEAISKIAEKFPEC